MDWLAVLLLSLGGVLVLVAMYFLSGPLSAVFNGLSVFGRVLSFSPRFFQGLLFLLVFGVIVPIGVGLFFAGNRVCVKDNWLGASLDTDMSGGTYKPYETGLLSALLVKVSPDQTLELWEQTEQKGFFQKIIGWVAGGSVDDQRVNGMGTLYSRVDNPAINANRAVIPAGLEAIDTVIVLPIGEAKSFEGGAGDSSQTFSICKPDIVASTTGTIGDSIAYWTAAVSGFFGGDDTGYTATADETCTLNKYSEASAAAGFAVSFLRGTGNGCPLGNRQVVSWTYEYDSDTKTMVVDNKILADWHKASEISNDVERERWTCRTPTSAERSSSEGWMVLQGSEGTNALWVKNAQYVAMNSLADSPRTLNIASKNVKQRAVVALSEQGETFDLVQSKSGDAVSYACNQKGDMEVRLYGLDVFNWQTFVAIYALIGVLWFAKWIGVF